MKKIQDLVVLVIEDEPVQRTCLAAQLRALGVQHILQAVDGRQAVRSMECLQVDLVFCDIGMPDMDGPQFMLQQRQRLGVQSCAAPMLVWMSVLGADMLASHLRLARMAGFEQVRALPKPLCTQAVTQLVEQAVTHAQACLRQAGQRCHSAPALVADDLLRTVCDADEFDVWYRPLLCLADGRIIGAEAEVRWSWPDQPAAGSPQLAVMGECQGLGLILFYRTVNHMFNVQARLQSAGHELLLCINASAQTLMVPEIADYLAERASMHRLRADRIVVLVSEAGSEHDPVSLSASLNRLRIKGFGLYLNGFGHGRANLEMLSDMPFNGLCIDARLVQHLPAHTPSRHLVQASVDLAASLGLTVVANGLSGEAAVRCLHAMGCNLGQGPVAKPVTAAGLLQAAEQAHASCA